MNEQPVTDRVRRTTCDPLSFKLQDCRCDSHITAGNTITTFRDIRDYVSSVSKDIDRSDPCGILKFGSTELTLKEANIALDKIKMTIGSKSEDTQGYGNGI